MNKTFLYKCTPLEKYCNLFWKQNLQFFCDGFHHFFSGISLYKVKNPLSKLKTQRKKLYASIGNWAVGLKFPNSPTLNQSKTGEEINELRVGSSPLRG